MWFVELGSMGDAGQAICEDLGHRTAMSRWQTGKKTGTQSHWNRRTGAAALTAALCGAVSYLQ